MTTSSLYVVAFVWLSGLAVVWLLCVAAKHADRRETMVEARAPAAPDPFAPSRRR